MSAKRGSQIEEWGNSRYQDGLKAGAAQRDALLAAAKAALSYIECGAAGRDSKSNTEHCEDLRNAIEETGRA